MPLFYLSFASEHGFLGACIIEAANGPEALAITHELGINPGGEALILPTPAGETPPFPQNRLLSREELGEGATLGETQRMGLQPPAGTLFVCEDDNG
jgi:hypothetical protein